ncbi:hypothetical protein BDF21DRAFT_405735 [Thamnidium elegans]|uniref:Uncharacterized protein n=1 Tax=Thamnidium elegans TaxID=101142 RepID=A0A8H7VWM3_9FUNG|nr:hypothetical protein INT48_000304 [Thamnidium elegans]KAI8095368.1 hypothetical protein BDF21DRAFT_405735 [Thamnidium elegans]
MSNIKQDFPVAFAEDINYPSNTEMYVEWLENSSEFPTLSCPSATHDANLDGDNWELLQRKETVEEDQHILVPLEDDDEWLNAEFEEDVLYSEVTEKNATELQPKKRAVKPLWPNENKPLVEPAEENDDDYEDEADLGTELVDLKRSQSRRANKLSRLRRIHDLKTVDNYVHGIYKTATTKGVIKSGAETDRIIKTRGGHARSDKQNALVLCSKYTHNMNRYTFKYIGMSKRPSVSSKDNCEFSVHSDIIVKL